MFFIFINNKISPMMNDKKITINPNLVTHPLSCSEKISVSSESG